MLLGFIVSPSRLRFESATSQNLTVTNGAKDPARFEVYADEYEKSFAIEPMRFDLAPNKSQIVSVKSKSEATVATNISIVSKANGAESIAFQTGIKIPVSVVQPLTSNLTASIGTTATWLIAIVLIGSVLLVWRSQRRRTG